MRIRFSKIVIIILIFSTKILFAQDVEGKLTKNQFKIDIITPGISFEHAFTKNMSIVADSHLWMGQDAQKEGQNKKTVGMQLVSLQYRYYLNLQRRLRKGKSTITNSGFYTGLIAEQAIYYGQSKSTLLYNAGVIAGFQQTFHNGFNVGIAAGGGYKDGLNQQAGYGAIIKFSMGVVLGGKRKYKQPALSTQ